MTEIPSSNAEAQIAKTACGGKLKDTAGYPSAVYGGELVFFCTRACLVGFEQDPDRFMAGEIEHPVHNS